MEIIEYIDQSRRSHLFDHIKIPLLRIKSKECNYLLTTWNVWGGYVLVEWLNAIKSYPWL